MQMALLECDSKEALKVCEEKFQLALATKTAQLQQACDNAIAAHKKTAQEALDEAVASTRDAVERTTAKAVEDEWREKLLAQKVALEEALQQACNEVEARVLQTSVEQHHVALKQWEEAKAAELAKVQSTLRGQFAQQTHDSEMALRREKEIAVQAVNDQWAMKLDALTSVQQALEEAEDASFDLQEELATVKKQHVFRHVMLVHSGMRKLQHLEDEVDSVYGNVYDTLVNYKRDQLVAHRSASNVVTSELSVLQAQIAEVVKTKSEGEDEVQKALAELGSLEEEIGAIQLMKDGHVNQAQVARKRRMHQEMEAMLEGIETKRTRVRTIETKQQELQSLHKQKEDEMKGLERQLVQILVEQQKQLLTLVTSVKTTSSSDRSSSVPA
ncbi:hypothetical protein DYB37_002201 [Aphanomyces astaci]|uniref:Uncharacterized protein n=1 Tax=Aphanomyces astaci TaxID=112090 RepID=A0A418E5D8_APHAT|nr:hypothetical protein DYB35_002946 [Aphanomyces astaci]RHZ06314.1 hypothetical protein DYB37_002201 [Aphanomyces astaci]